MYIILCLHMHVYTHNIMYTYNHNTFHANYYCCANNLHSVGRVVYLFIFSLLYVHIFIIHVLVGMIVSFLIVVSPNNVSFDKFVITFAHVCRKLVDKHYSLLESSSSFSCRVPLFGAIQVLRNAIFLEIGPPPTPS